MTWEQFSEQRLRGCWRVAFELGFIDGGVPDAFYNAPAGYRAQFARSSADGDAANRWLLDRLMPKLLQACQERGVDLAPVTASLMGEQAKTWILEPSDNSHLKGDPAILCHQWSGPGQCAPITRCRCWRQSVNTVIMDTTVQPNAIAHPTDSRLLNRAREQLVGAAQDASIEPRRSYARVGKARGCAGRALCPCPAAQGAWQATVPRS